MAQHEDQHSVEDAPDTGAEQPYEGSEAHEAHEAQEADVDNVLASIERELTSLVERCEQTTAQHARELTQRQAEIDRTLQIALKRQVEIDRQSAQLRGLADEVVQADRALTDRRRALADRLRRRRAWMADRMTAAVDTHARRAADEIETRAKELAKRESELAMALEDAHTQSQAAQSDRENIAEVRKLIDEQATMTAEHAKTVDGLLSQREQASQELVERLSDACGLADRVRALSDQLRESRLETRELAERVEVAERERGDTRGALDAARARIAQLESRIEGLSRDKLLLEQRSQRLEQEAGTREAKLASRETMLKQEALRLADDQAACDNKLRELGTKLAQHDRVKRERWLDPRTPLATSSMPVLASPRRRPELRFVD